MIYPARAADRTFDPILYARIVIVGKVAPALLGMAACTKHLIEQAIHGTLGTVLGMRGWVRSACHPQGLKSMFCLVSLLSGGNFSGRQWNDIGPRTGSISSHTDRESRAEQNLQKVFARCRRFVVV